MSLFMGENMKISEIKSQKGGLLVEALAILGIVAVTSPMIYKKKVDKAQELDDIAKASQMKIVKEAVANYVDAKYDTYIKDFSDADPVGKEKTYEIKMTDLGNFLPPGFDHDDTIKIGVLSEKISTDKDNPYRVSAIVVDGEKFNEKRGNRIASLIGADGGYAGADGNATGNNNVWSIDTKKFGFKGEKSVGSQIVSTTQFSKSAASGEYLYKYKVEGQPQVNTMMTNINMRGNDLNNVSSVGLKFGKTDEFNSWRLNGHENDGQQYGNGTIVGKNRSGFDTVALQSNRYGTTDVEDKTTDLALNNGANGTDQDGSGAMILRADAAHGGCTEALAKSDIGVGDGAGIFTACNNNAKRVAYLMAKGEGNGGELRLRTYADGNDKIGATVYSNADNKGAAFEATDAAGRVAASIASEKMIEKPHHYNSSLSSDAAERASLELSYQNKERVTATSDEQGGALYLRDKNSVNTVELIGDEALAMVTDKNKGHAGLTGDYQAGLTVNEVYPVTQKAPTAPNHAERGAFFVRDNTDSKTIAMVGGQANPGSTDVGANMILNNGDTRAVRASSVDGGALYMFDSAQRAKVSVEGERHLGTLMVNGDNKGYAEVRGVQDNTAAEMYSSAVGTLGKDGGSGSTFGDNTSGGGAYLGYHESSTPTVKFMSSAGHASGSNEGGVLDLSTNDQGQKAILTTAVDSATGGGVGSAMRLSTGDDNYAHFGANGKNGAGDMVLQGGSGKVTAVAQNSSGGALTLSKGGADGAAIIKATADGVGRVQVGNSGDVERVVFEGGAVTAYNTSTVGTAKISSTGLNLTNSSGKKRVDFTAGALEYYNPSDQKAVFSDGSKFQAGQNKGLNINVANAAGDAYSKLKTGVDKVKTGTDVKGVILIKGDVTAPAANAAVVKTDGDIKIKDICILGKSDTATKDDAACLSDAAAYDAEISGHNITQKEWHDKYGDLSGQTDGKKNFGRALWQLIAERVTDKLESIQHNDTHHLKSAWGGEVTVGGTKISGGTAFLRTAPKYSPHDVTYVNNKAGYVYLTKDDANYTRTAGLNLSYYNIEKGANETITNSAEYQYKRHNGDYPGEEAQYSAAGHEHGALGATAHTRYKPTFTNGQSAKAGDWGGGRKSVKASSVPQEPNQYVATGHYHLNYDAAASGCYGSVKYTSKKIIYGCVGGEAYCVSKKEEERSCSHLSGKDFYQGQGNTTAGLIPNKWNTNGETFEVLPITQ